MSPNLSGNSFNGVRELPQSSRARFKSAVGQTDIATPTPHAHAVALGALGSMHAPSVATLA